MFKIFAHWQVIVGSLLLWTFVSACGSKQPAVVDEGLKNPTSSISHVNLTSKCAECHEPDREPDVVDLVTVKHGLGADCSDCHSFPAFATIKAEVKAHSPAPTYCLGCHDLVKEKAPHVKRGDCYPCHQFGANWTPK